MWNVIRVPHTFAGTVRRFGIQLGIARGSFRVRGAQVCSGPRGRWASFKALDSHRYEFEFGDLPWRRGETLELCCEHSGALPAVIRRVDLDAVKSKAGWAVDLVVELEKLARASGDPIPELGEAKRLFLDLDRETNFAAQHASKWTDPKTRQLLAELDPVGHRSRFAAVMGLPTLLLQSLRARTYLEAPAAPVAATEAQWRMLRLIGELHHHWIASRFGDGAPAVRSAGRAFVHFAARRLVREVKEPESIDRLYLNGEPDSANFLLFAELFHLLANDAAPATPVELWRGLEPYLAAAEAAFGHVYEPRPPYRKDLLGYSFERHDAQRSNELDVDGLIDGMLALSPKQLARRQRDVRRCILYELYGHMPGVRRSPEEFWDYEIPSLGVPSLGARPARPASAPAPSPASSPGASPAIKKLRLKPVEIDP